MKRIGDILTRNKTSVVVQDGTVYKQVTIRTNYQGVELRGLKEGSNILTKNQFTVSPGQFILSRIDARNSAFGIIPHELDGAIITNDFLAFDINESEVDREFFNVFLQSPAFLGACIRASRGNTNRKRINEAFFLNYEVNLPPLREQLILIKKISKTRLQVALAQKEIDHQKNLLSNFRQAILFEAIQGKLTADWRAAHASKEPAGRLLHRIQTENALRSGHKKVHTEKPLSEIAPAEIPFEIPKDWEWCRYGSLCEYVTSGSRGWQQYYSSSGALFIRAQNIKTDKLCLDDEAFVDLPKEVEGTRAKVKRDDVLITITGGNLGKTALIQDDFDEAYASQHIALTRLVDTRLANWIHLTFTTDSGPRGQLMGLSRGDKPGLNLQNIRNVLIPLPPIAEQAAIVARVEALMSKCKGLEAAIDHLCIHAGYLQKAILSEAFPAVALKEIVETATPNFNQMAGKTKNDTGIDLPIFEPLPCSLQAFVLRSFKMSSGYRSLDNPNCEFHSDTEFPTEAAPICLVGLNGSGKSNLIEAIADAFCFLELINLPWKSLRSTSSKYRGNDHKFEISYTITDTSGTRLILIRKTKKLGAEFFEISNKGYEVPIDAPRDRLSVLPRRIIGYSSGLNETVSHTFLRTRTLYSQEVRDAAPKVGEPLSNSKKVFDTRTLYMDYENNSQILLCNYIFCAAEGLEFIKRFTRVSGVYSFDLRFNRNIAGKTGEFSIARLTDELVDYIKKFARCAGQNYNEEEMEHHFSYDLNSATKRLFVKEFGTAEKLFLAMYKWSLLNALVMSDDQRKAFLKDDITKGTLERPPVVPPKSRLFDVADMKVTLSEPKITIDYSGLSDGEHQFVQVFGTVMLFNEPGTLFLFDEPESHFNPEWRTQFNSILNNSPNASTHEYVISTHSPYIVSGARAENVLKFERKGAQVTCNPVDFETYGASFDMLLNKLFSIKSLIDESARKELGKILSRGNLEEMESAVGEFAESHEKRRLYEAILRKQNGKQ